MINLSYLGYPLFLSLRFFVWLIAKTSYRLKFEGLENIPKKGSAFLLVNHITYIDWAFLASTTRRPIRFVLYHTFYNIPVFKWFCMSMKVIPVAQGKDNLEVKEQAFVLMKKAIDQGDLICIFPEGTLTSDGKLLTFRSGYEKVLEQTDTQVIPIAMTGLWGSYFSRKGGRAFLKLPKPSRRKLLVKVLPPISKEEAKAEQVQELIHREIDQMNKKFDLN